MKGALSLEMAVQMVIVLVVVSSIIGAVVRILPESSSDIGGQRTIRRGRIEKQCQTECFDVKGATSEEERLEKVLEYCTRKFSSDINDDGELGKVGGGFYTYCEDGIRCFHLSDCESENVKLNPENCVRQMCDYYTEVEDLTSNQASQQISRIFSGLEEDDQTGLSGYGTCSLESSSFNTWYDELESMKQNGFCE